MSNTHTQAGNLRSRVTLQQRSDSADGAGGVARSWQDVATLWAEITPLSGREAFRYGRQESTVTHRFRMRWRSGVHAQMRFVYDGRSFNIRHCISPGEAKIWLDCWVEEGSAT